SCCFHIPDFSDNITDVVTHMRKAVKEPERVSGSWMKWFDDLGGGWVHWLIYTVLPIGATILMMIICLPCIYKCLVFAVRRMMMSHRTHQMVKVPVNMDNAYLEWLEREKDEPNTTSDESSI
ncbi:MAG: hypothetical protein ACRCZO_18010, partial [Cetobacterium sp.]